MLPEDADTVTMWSPALAEGDAEIMSFADPPAAIASGENV
jgi:hypothetical protein